MSAMTMEFDGVRELSMEEVDAVAGGVRTAILRVGQHLLKVARDTALGTAMMKGAEEAGDAIGEAVGDAAKDAYASSPQHIQQGLTMMAASRP